MDLLSSWNNSIVFPFIFYILSYLLSKTMGCFSGCLMSSASDQKLFCGVCSAFEWSFDEFVGEKVVSLSLFLCHLSSLWKQFQILKDNALKALHLLCKQVWKTQQSPQDWKRSVFIAIPKKGNAKECSNYGTIVLISHASKVMLKILQARLQQ